MGVYRSEESRSPDPMGYVADKPVGFVGIVLFSLCFVCTGFDIAGNALGVGNEVNLGPWAIFLEVVQWLFLLGSAIGCIGILLSVRWGFLLGVFMPVGWVLAMVIYFVLFWDGIRSALEAQAFERNYERMAEGGDRHLRKP